VNTALFAPDRARQGWWRLIWAIFAPMRIMVVGPAQLGHGAALRCCLVQVSGSGCLWTPERAAVWVWRGELVTISLPIGCVGSVRTCNLAGPRWRKLPPGWEPESNPVEVAFSTIAMPEPMDTLALQQDTVLPELYLALCQDEHFLALSGDFFCFHSNLPLAWPVGELPNTFEPLPPIPSQCSEIQ
jgi:hypothetical protein